LTQPDEIHGNGMLHVVELRHVGTDQSGIMKEMRAWLDRNRVNAVRFEQSVGGPSVTFRVWFADEAQAKAFAEAFAGRPNCSTSQSGAPWQIAERRPPPGTIR
jgi:hypothetical protein